MGEGKVLLLPTHLETSEERVGEPEARLRAGLGAELQGETRERKEGKKKKFKASGILQMIQHPQRDPLYFLS